MPNVPWFIGVFTLLFLGWLITIGPEAGNVEKPFLEPPPPIGEGGTYGPSLSAPKKEAEKTYVDMGGNTILKQDSLLGEQIALSGYYLGNSTNPNEEYLVIIASDSNTRPVNITGWKLQSAITGRSTVIDRGTYLFRSGQVNTEQSVFLNPGDRAFVVTGRSPVGVSFKLNACTGYLEQFQNFAPQLPLQCPHPLEENFPTGPQGLSNECIDYLRLFPRCAIHTLAIPPQFSGLCQDYIQKVTYTECVEKHKSDSNFYKPEWRIFLKRDAEMWKERYETIYLLTESGKLVDSISY